MTETTKPVNTAGENDKNEFKTNHRRAVAQPCVNGDR